MTHQDPPPKSSDPAAPEPAPAGAPPPSAAAVMPARPVWRPAPRQIAAIVAISILCAVIAVYLLPRQPMVSRSIAIAAPPATVFALVSDLRRFAEWSPWLAGETEADMVYTGPAEGEGQTIAWPGKGDAKAGEAVVTGLDSDKRADMRVTFAGEPPMLVSFSVVPAASGATVIWRVRPDVGFNPVDRIGGLWIDGRVGPGLEAGLARLKAVAEAPQPEDKPPPAGG